MPLKTLAVEENKALCTVSHAKSVRQLTFSYLELRLKRKEILKWTATSNLGTIAFDALNS